MSALALIGGIVFLYFCAITANSYSYKLSTFNFILSLACFLFLVYGTSIFMPPYTFSLAKVFDYVVTYLVLGFVFSFVYWIFYCWEVKERYEKYVLNVINSLSKDQYFSSRKFRIRVVWEKRNSNESISVNETPKFVEALLKADLIIENAEAILKKRNVFNSTTLKYSYLTEYIQVADKKCLSKSAAERDDELSAVVYEYISKILPPKFANNKQEIVWASVYWPVTMLGILFDKFFSRIVEKIISMFGQTYNKISALAFGKF